MTRENLATVLALTVTCNAAIIVMDASDSTCGVAIFSALVNAYGRPDGAGMSYILQLKAFSFYQAGGSSVFRSKFVAICDDFRTRLDRRPPRSSTT